MKQLLLPLIVFPLLLNAKPPKGWQKEAWKVKEKVLAEFYAPQGADLAAMKKAVQAVDKGNYEKPFKVLVIYRCGGYVHTSIPSGNSALELLGAHTGAFSVETTGDYAALEYENLSQYDVVFFNNTTRLGLSKHPKSQEGLLKFVSEGKGYAGVHAASDTFYDWEEGQKLVGGLFAGHPWNAPHSWAFKLETPDHPVLKGFNQDGFWLKDEIYQYGVESFDRNRSRVLVSLDFSGEKNREKMNVDKAQKVHGDDVANYDVPVSWIHEYEQGRVFYTNFGHNPQTFHQTNILQHIYEGLQYAAGNLKADAMPSGKLDKVKLAPAPEK